VSCIVIQYEYKVPNTHAAPLPHSPWMILLLAARH